MLPGLNTMSGWLYHVTESLLEARVHADFVFSFTFMPLFLSLPSIMFRLLYHVTESLLKDIRLKLRLFTVGVLYPEYCSMHGLLLLVC